MDGINLWPALSDDTKSDRNEILHNIDDIYGSASLTVGEWKVHKGTNYKGIWDKWYGPAGVRSPTAYNANAVYHSPAGQALTKLNLLPSLQQMRKLRIEATIDCPKNLAFEICRPLEKPCLFNIVMDPCEQNNMAEKYPDILSDMLTRLKAYNATAIPPANIPLDPNADPRFFDNTWANFGDFVTDVMSK